MVQVKLLCLLLLSIPCISSVSAAGAGNGPSGGPFAVSRIASSIGADEELNPGSAQALTALDVFERGCLGGAMHKDSVSRWASENGLVAREPAMYSALLRETLQKVWIKPGANGPVSDVILAAPGPGKCMVVMIQANAELASRKFLELMAFQENNGIKLQRFPDHDTELSGSRGVRKLVTFASLPEGQAVGLLWTLEYTSAKNAVALKFRSELVRQ